jgi:hypothetical protein
LLSNAISKEKPKLLQVINEKLTDMFVGKRFQKIRRWFSQEEYISGYRISFYQPVALWIEVGGDNDSFLVKEASINCLKSLKTVINNSVTPSSMSWEFHSSGNNSVFYSIRLEVNMYLGKSMTRSIIEDALEKQYAENQIEHPYNFLSWTAPDSAIT